MQEAYVDKRMLAALAEKLELAPEVLREQKRQAFELVSGELLAAVQTRIGGTGKVAGWQERFTGSGGGWAAARPRAKQLTEPGKRSGKRYAVGYVTNAVNSGHRTPGGGRVTGRWFYQKSQAQAEALARKTMERITQGLTDRLEE